jgi:hypothetical protein
MATSELRIWVGWSFLHFGAKIKSQSHQCVVDNIQNLLLRKFHGTATVLENI